MESFSSFLTGNVVLYLAALAFLGLFTDAGIWSFVLAMMFLSPFCLTSSFASSETGKESNQSKMELLDI